MTLETDVVSVPWNAWLPRSDKWRQLSLVTLLADKWIGLMVSPLMIWNNMVGFCFYCTSGKPNCHYNESYNEPGINSKHNVTEQRSLNFSSELDWKEPGELYAYSVTYKDIWTVLTFCNPSFVDIQSVVIAALHCFSSFPHFVYTWILPFFPLLFWTWHFKVVVEKWI